MKDFPNRAAPSAGVLRGAFDAKDAERAITAHQDHQAAQIAAQLKHHGDADAALGITPIQHADYGVFKTKTLFDRHRAEVLETRSHAPNHTLEFTLPLGDRIIAPPYDVEWVTGVGFPFVKYDGKLMTFGTGDKGYSASGVGVFLTTEVPAFVTVTPMGTYDFSWASLGDYPALRSFGGLGGALYAGGDATPAHSSIATLWRVAGAHQFQGAQGSGRITDAVGAVTPLGNIPVFPISFNMQPGTRYLLWVWAWEAGSNVAGTAFISYMRVVMPFLTVRAAPPVILR